MIRLVNVLKTSLQDALKMSWRRLQNFLKTSWRRLENVLKTSWRRMAKTNILVLTKTSWRRLEDVFWRRKAKANIFVLIKTSWRRLLKTKTKDVFKTSSSRRMFLGRYFHNFNDYHNCHFSISLQKWAQIGIKSHGTCVNLRAFFLFTN